MKSAILNLSFEKGADFVRGFQWVKTDLTPMADISAWAVDFEIFDEPGGSSLYSKDEQTSVVSISGSSAYIEIHIPSTDTEGFEFTKAWYEIRLTSGSSQAFRLVSGGFYGSRHGFVS